MKETELGIVMKCRDGSLIKQPLPYRPTVYKTKLFCISFTVSAFKIISDCMSFAMSSHAKGPVYGKGMQHACA